MALARNRELFYENPVDFIRHVTGKELLSWRRSMHRFQTEVFFTDGTMCLIDEAMPIDWSKIEYLQIPKSICASCGQDAHASYWNWKNQCSATVKAFWEKARKVYWHRRSSHN